MLTINGFEEKNCQQFLCEHEFCFYKESNREFAYIFLIDAEKLQYIQKAMHHSQQYHEKQCLIKYKLNINVYYF